MENQLREERKRASRAQEKLEEAQGNLASERQRWEKEKEALQKEKWEAQDNFAWVARKLLEKLIPKSDSDTSGDAVKTS